MQFKIHKILKDKIRKKLDRKINKDPILNYEIRGNQLKKKPRRVSLIKLACMGHEKKSWACRPRATMQWTCVIYIFFFFKRC